MERRIHVCVKKIDLHQERASNALASWVSSVGGHEMPITPELAIPLDKGLSILTKARE